MRGCARECVQGCACAWCGWNRMCVLKKQERKCVRLRDRMRIGVSMVERESACVCVAENFKDGVWVFEFGSKQA